MNHADPAPTTPRSIERTQGPLGPFGDGVARPGTGEGSGVPPERDALGRFVEGNAGGPGNPHARRVAQLRSALLEALTPADVQRMARAMVELAAGGDVAAFVALLGYALGKPRAIADAADPGEPEPRTMRLRFDRHG